MFLVSTGVSHQRHLLWQHLSHHLQKIQQILWPPGNHPSLMTPCPGYRGFLLKSFTCLPTHAFWTREPARLFVQINLQALWLFPAVVFVFHPLTPLWISVWVSNWSGSRGDMAWICQTYGVAATCHISLSLSPLPPSSLSLSLASLSLYLSSVQTSPSRLSSPLCCTLQMSGSRQTFLLYKPEKTKREINLMYWALWQVLNATPVVGEEGREGWWWWGGVTLKEIHCTSSINNSILFESLCARMPFRPLSLLQTDTRCILDQRVTSKYVGVCRERLTGGRNK